MKRLIVICFTVAFPVLLLAQHAVPVKPRILISTDIGGTDPDDNQSMIHFLMYSDMFQTEGLISSPSFGEGSKKNILQMIDLYEKDLPKLKQHSALYPSPHDLRAICKQGRHGPVPYMGYATATEGSDWIIKCAQKKSKSNQPLWVLVWGGLDDVAQALHDAPSIVSKIRVYWIGGPNKKWGINAYAYIAGHFPNLWIIENNATYHGFFSDIDTPEKDDRYYDQIMSGHGYMGADFKNYYGGHIKMGDTPALLYMMDGNPANPLKESWGGSFEAYSRSPRRVFSRVATLNDTVPVYSVVELHFKGPVINAPADSACFTMSVKAKIGEQRWPGFYLGNGQYAIRYSPKQAEALSYNITSTIPGFIAQNGQLSVSNNWPGPVSGSDYSLGKNWYGDNLRPGFFYGEKQGAGTILKWRKDILGDWAKRWAWLK